MDVAFFGAELRWPAWSNYFWVWLAIHNLGFAWRDGRMGNPGQLLIMSLLALATMWVLVFPGPYPLAMVGSPDQALSNTTPPLRQVTGAMVICLGVALLALFGFGGGPLPGLDLASMALIAVGSGVSGVLPGLR